MARPIKVLSTSDEVRAELRRRAKGRSTEHRDRFRAEIILLRLEGLKIKDVAERMNTSMRTVSLWSSRFEKTGLDGLADKGGQGRKPSLPEAKVARVITEATRPPKGLTRWSVPPCRHLPQHSAAHLVKERVEAAHYHDVQAAPDPTNVFNLFGLIPFDPTQVPVIGHFLWIGAWPIILGLTVWQLQQKISPILLGSFQRKVYAFLPFLVIYFSANMMAAILIYFTWYNCLSIVHQLLLMKKEKGAVGNISEYSAEVLSYGKIQPIVFLTMLAPILQNLFMILVFWRRNKNAMTENPLISRPK